ncbi:MAG: hypothetical protein M5U34_23350 [Chloroflexi bacterium]|nr:hypothetical protein [Chloroflexota bacterium]
MGVRQAQVGVDIAETGVTQAQAAITQAESWRHPGGGRRHCRPGHAKPHDVKIHH